MSDEQVRQQPSLQRVTFLGRLALFGDDCLDLALTRKSRMFLGVCMQEVGYL